MEAYDHHLEELQVYRCRCLDDQSEYELIPSMDLSKRVPREGRASLDTVGGSSPVASTSSDETLPMGGTPKFPCPGIGWTWESGLGVIDDEMAEHLQALAEEEAKTESLLVDP
jgi:hypothetical protein